MNSLGELIIKLREDKEFSQRQLALYAKVSNTEISKIESGERQKPNPDILKRIAPVLGTSYEELMIAAGYMPEKYNLSGEVQRLKQWRDENFDLIELGKKLKDNNIDIRIVSAYVDGLINKK